MASLGQLQMVKLFNGIVARRGAVKMGELLAEAAPILLVCGRSSSSGPNIISALTRSGILVVKDGMVTTKSSDLREKMNRICLELDKYSKRKTAVAHIDSEAETFGIYMTFRDGFSGWYAGDDFDVTDDFTHHNVIKYDSWADALGSYEHIINTWGSISELIMMDIRRQELK